MTVGSDFYDSLFGRSYSAYMERPWLNRWIARVLWGGDTRPYYESMAAVAEVPPGDTIVDCPCGAGPAFRALEPTSTVRYIGAHFSPAMVARARKRAAERGLEQIEAPVEGLPLEGESANLFLTYWGIHCFPDPEAAVNEMARVLRPGGRLVGCTFVRGKSIRQRLLLRPNTTDFGRLCTEPELLDWLREAEFVEIERKRSGLFMFFEAQLGS
jgi:ubiquinone/menaquinone biosynthesis C-methylase UbiE